MKPNESDPSGAVPTASVTSANGVAQGEEFIVQSAAPKTTFASGNPSRTTSQSGDDWSASLSEEEDYDKQELDMKAMVEGSEGGGLKSASKLDNGGTMIPKASRSEQVLYDSNKSIEASSPRHSLGGRKRSIHVTLEKTDRKGKYILTADDPEYREIMRSLIEKQEAEATKAKRPRFRDLVFTRRFTTFDRQNPLSHDSPFYGFFTLFWIGVGALLLRIAAYNWRDHGSVLGEAQLFRMMFERDLLVLGITDGVMCAATLFGYFLQKLIVKGYLSWSRTGWIIQNLWQCFYLFMCLWWAWFRKWPWSHTVFMVLHCIVFLMKQHSYAFYNGYLSQVSRRRRILCEKLRQLDETEPSASPRTPEKPFSTARDESTHLSGSQSTRARTRRRASSNAKSKTSTNLSKETSEIAAIAKAIDSGLPLDEAQLAAFSDIMRNEIDALTEELRGKSTKPEHAYPNNLTIANWADWTCLPTLVYELEYPRQESRSWLYIVEKSVATLGCIWVMMVVSQAYIYPLVVETVRMKDRGMTLEERWREYPWILGDMLFPLLLEQLLTWYVIWECILNVLAELTLFADRGFYGDWWNSVSFDQYARDWNRPVHNFLLRHVYHSSISSFKLSKGTATFVTFLLSALVHELVMLCIFKKLRGYLFFMQLCQLPLAALSRTKLLKGRDILGNTLFWFALFVGPAIIMSLYLIV